MGDTRNEYSILLGNMKGRSHAEDLDVDRKIILEWIVGNRMAGFLPDSNGSG
jgi:hypothetical protein